ncbi:NUDIX hydrolase [Prolixibacteraceae bacterium JC049]|nr:NUDIX hydrolase [Prolixibacteraceae bacterium JC049]
MGYTYEYPRPALTVDAIIVAKRYDDFQVLLIRRKNDPFKGYWALPGGFVDAQESLKQACKRELQEETGLTGVPLKQFHTFGKPGRDPRGHTVSVVYYSVVNECYKLQGGDDAEEARWFPLKDLPDMSFDHEEILKKFNSKLRFLKII